MKVTKKFKGCYLIHINGAFVGWIDKLENINEWICYDKFDRPFETCNTKKYALTLFYIGVNV